MNKKIDKIINEIWNKKIDFGCEIAIKHENKIINVKAVSKKLYFYKWKLFKIKEKNIICNYWIPIKIWDVFSYIDNKFWIHFKYAWEMDYKDKVFSIWPNINSNLYFQPTETIDEILKLIEK